MQNVIRQVNITMHLWVRIYERITKKTAPYYFHYSPAAIIMKPIRKWFTNTFAANCPFNCIRILIYRLCGFRIGKKVFIGMKTYLDDMCFDLMTIGNHVTISYCVYFACHGKKQGHYPITIEDGVYIGMRSCIISKNRNGTQEGIVIGKNAVIGACTLVNCDVPEKRTAVGIPCRILESPSE